MLCVSYKYLSSVSGNSLAYVVGPAPSQADRSIESLSSGRSTCPGHMDMIVRHFLRPEALNPPSLGTILWASTFDDYFQGT